MLQKSKNKESRNVEGTVTFARPKGDVLPTGERLGFSSGVIQVKKRFGSVRSDVIRTDVNLRDCYFIKSAYFGKHGTDGYRLPPFIVEVAAVRREIPSVRRGSWACSLTKLCL